MVTLTQVLQALNSDDDSIKEAAAKSILDEYRLDLSKGKSSILSQTVLIYLLKQMSNDNVVFRRTLAEFILEFVRSGNSLGLGWVYLASLGRSEDPQIRLRVSESYNYLNKDETILKSCLDNSKLSDAIRFYSGEALTHFYLKKKYFDSFIKLLAKDPIVVKAVYSGYNSEKNLRSISVEDIKLLEPNILNAQARFNKKYEKPKEPVRRILYKDKKH